jgi:hypothetical protein
MSNQREDILTTGGDERPVRTYWWAPSSMLTPEAGAITAFTLAVISTLGFGSWTLLTQSVLGAPTGQDDIRGQNLLSAAILLATALGAILLAGGVLRGAAARASNWASQLARAAVAVAAFGALLSAVTIIGTLLRHSPAGY